MQVAMIIEVLPAAYGDCLLISCPTARGTWRLLVDTGPDETWPILRHRLAQLPADREGHRHIDLAIVSHIDHDHIGSASLLFSDTSLNLTFGDVWFNGRQHLEGKRGVAEGEALSTLLGASPRELPWNRAFGGGAAVTADHGAVLELSAAADLPRLTLLSPTPKRLERLASVWAKELEKLRLRQSTSADPDTRGDDFPNLERLASIKSPRDQSAANGSSIAVLLEHAGRSVLLAADAFANVLGSAMLELAQRRKISIPFQIDVLKLSHHGSRANSVTEMFAALRAKHYIISTDNSHFNHPDDEALAKVILFGGSHPTLHFNHATARNRRWENRELQKRYDYTTHFPRDTDVGLKLTLHTN